MMGLMGVSFPWVSEVECQPLLAEWTWPKYYEKIFQKLLNKFCIQADYCYLFVSDLGC